MKPEKQNKLARQPDNGLIILESSTAANKAKSYLRSLQINAAVEKSSSKGGSCAYGIRTSEDPEKVCRLLSVINLKCREIVYKE